MRKKMNKPILGIFVLVVLTFAGSALAAPITITHDVGLMAPIVQQVVTSDTCGVSVTPVAVTSNYVAVSPTERGDVNGKAFGEGISELNGTSFTIGATNYRIWRDSGTSITALLNNGSPIATSITTARISINATATNN